MQICIYIDNYVYMYIYILCICMFCFFSIIMYLYLFELFFFIPFLLYIHMNLVFIYIICICLFGCIILFEFTFNNVDGYFYISYEGRGGAPPAAGVQFPNMGAGHQVSICI
jgi:hypothetical protein